MIQKKRTKIYPSNQVYASQDFRNGCKLFHKSSNSQASTVSYIQPFFSFFSSITANPWAKVDQNRPRVSSFVYSPTFRSRVFIVIYFFRFLNLHFHRLIPQHFHQLYNLHRLILKRLPQMLFQAVNPVCLMLLYKILLL